jgi:hypothetical protein
MPKQQSGPPTHPFSHDDAVPLDQFDRQWCACGLPEMHPAHVLPPTPESDQSARIVGERSEP